jgi:site-specific recombinase XerD
MARPTQHKASEFTLSIDEIQRLFCSADPAKGAPNLLRNRTLLKLLYYCGLRRSEAASLDVRDIDFDRRLLHIVGKGDKERVVPVPMNVLSDLRVLIERRTSGPVFLSQKGGSIRSDYINLILQKAAEHAGVTNPNPRRKHVNPHLLRHSFVRHFLDGGGNLRTAAAIVGHEDPATTAKIYGTPSIEYNQAQYLRWLEKQEKAQSIHPGRDRYTL